MRKISYVENNHFSALSLRELEDIKTGCEKVMGLLFFAFFMSIFLSIGRGFEVPAEGMAALSPSELSRLLSLGAIAASVGDASALLMSTGTASILLCAVARIRHGAVVRIAKKEYVPDSQRLNASSLEDAVRLVRSE